MNLKDKLTILVCSCDAYSDLWTPFFILLKKYWQDIDLQILLNTEEKKFSFSDLNIKCVHPKNKYCSYGERMQQAISKVKTKYVLLLLDDFFIRKDVKLDNINNIIQYMDLDKSIAMFTCNTTKVYSDWETNKYLGYRRVPYGNNYTLTMQAGIWRTKIFKKYWENKVSPWDWEEICNVLTTFNKKIKFYSAITKEFAFLDYGQGTRWWGVYNGKWVLDDVKPLFEKENISVDYSKRGTMFSGENIVIHKNFRKEDKKVYSKELYRCLGFKAWLDYRFFRLFYGLIKVKYEPFGGDYISFLQYKAQVYFCKKIKNVQGIHVVTKREFLGRIKNKIRKRFMRGK